MLKKTILLTLISVVASALGFLVQALLFRSFGATLGMDFFFYESAIPFAIVGMSPIVISSIVIPYFSKCKVQGLSMTDRGYFLFKCMLTAGPVVSIIGCLIAYIDILKFNDIYNFGMFSDARELMLILWSAAAIGIISSFLISVLNYNGNFISSSWPTILPAFIVMLVIIFQNEPKVLNISEAYLSSAVIQFLVLFLYAKKYFSAINLNDGFYNELMVLSKKIPIMIISLLPFSAFSPISYHIAYKLPVGSISILGYGQSFGGFLSVAASMGAAIVSFPSLSSAHANGNNSTELKKFEKSVLYVIMFSIFSASVLISIISPLIELVYGGRGIDFKSVQLIKNIVPIYLCSAVFISGLNLLRSLAYSRGDYNIISIIGIISLVCFYLLSIVGVDYIYIYGIAVSNFLSFMIFFILLIYYYEKSKVTYFNLNFYVILLKVTISSSIAYGATYIFSEKINSFSGIGSVLNIFILALLNIICFIVASVWIVRIKEVITIATGVVSFKFDRDKKKKFD